MESEQPRPAVLPPGLHYLEAQGLWQRGTKTKQVWKEIKQRYSWVRTCNLSRAHPCLPHHTPAGQGYTPTRPPGERFSRPRPVHPPIPMDRTHSSPLVHFDSPLLFPCTKTDQERGGRTTHTHTHPTYHTHPHHRHVMSCTNRLLVVSFLAHTVKIPTQSLFPSIQSRSSNP